MVDNRVTKVVILGGGTSGWMTAAALAKFFEGKDAKIILVESELIGTVGVGEATLPHLRYFNERLGISEHEFMRRTQATFKLGIEFANWGQKGDAYIHPFGDYGQPIKDVSFHHYWVRQWLAGQQIPIDKYSLSVTACKADKFNYPDRDPASILSSFSYAFHLDAGLYAKYLREYSEALGVVRREGSVQQVKQHADTGFVTSLILASGEEIEGELFIDCSGFRGLLIEQTLKTGYESWSQWLPCDRAVAIPCVGEANIPPYTKAAAQSAGWQWKIPLQHRTGNGYVYASDHISDDEAAGSLLAKLSGEALAEPNFLRFTAGKRKKSWCKNVVAIGLAGGFLEPLESTSIYLIQIAIMKFMRFFPSKSFDENPIAEFNKVMMMEFDRVRDFLILHYHATERDDTPFWQYCRNMNIPEDLKFKMELFRARGHVASYEGGLFLEPSWVAVYLGQRIIPKSFDPRALKMSNENIENYLARMRGLIEAAAGSMTPHVESVRRYCALDGNAMVPGSQMSLYGSGFGRK